MKKYKHLYLNSNAGTVQFPAIMFLILVALFTVINGCSPKESSYVNSAYEFHLVKKVAVFPFSNNSSNPQAAERIRMITVTELLSRRTFLVLEPSFVNQAIASSKVSAVEKLEPDEVEAISKKLGADAVVLGSVDSYKVTSYNSMNTSEVTVTLRMLDVKSGEVVWMATRSTKTPGFAARALGVGNQSLSESAQKVVTQICDTLFLAKRGKPKS